MTLNQKKSTVLIVDDVAENIHVLMGTLKDDYAILAARDGQKALDIAQSKLPDIILLDIMMPEMDGYEVCLTLKKLESTKHIPIIFITALSESDDEAKGLEMGAVDFIAKPFNPDLVKSRVRNHLELKKYRDQLEELVEARTQELQQTQEVTIESMASLVVIKLKY